MRTLRKLITATAGAAVIAGSSLLVAPAGMAAPAPQPEPMADFDPKAASEPHEAVGYRASPGQPYAQNPTPEYDWLGSYKVDGKQVWCVQFALTAPNTDEEYRPGDALRTKWGDPLKPDIAANISYLLLRYGDTKSNDEAAALAHLLHSWTAAPRSPMDLSPTNGFETIGYNIDSHFDKLPPSAKQMLTKMREEAKSHRGPWTASLTAPQGQQIIGESTEWTLNVRKAKGEGVGDVPIKLKVQDASVEGLGEDGIIRTPADGSPLKLKVTPTGPNPKINGTLSTPADHPYVRQAVNAPNTTQRVVSTGGEKELAVNAATQAVTAPGSVAVLKVDAKSGEGIGGVTLRITGPDKSSPVTRQNDSQLRGPDGAPAVLTTQQDGNVAVPDLKTPQEICVLETAPAKGYEQAFDPAKPPSACGKLKPGETLRLSLSNKANAPSVPVAIPAGDGTTPLSFGPDDGGSDAAGSDAAGPDAGGIPAGLVGLVGLGSLALAGAGLALRRGTAKQ